MPKYARLRERGRAGDLSAHCRVAEAAHDRQIVLAHDPDYLRRVRDGLLTRSEQRSIGFPWSTQMLERACHSSGATLAACRSALERGTAANLAGGTYHTFRDRGEGYCVLNDSAIALRVLQAEGRVRRALVIDCDVHQGNGTAAIFRYDPSVFTFSIHGANNFPPCKEQSDLDIELPDGTGDREYLDALGAGLAQALVAANAELAVYLAGADPYFDDRLGRLALTRGGLMERDRMVLAACNSAGLAAAVTMAGGYARDIADTVDIHYATLQTAAWFCRH